MHKKILENAVKYFVVLYVAILSCGCNDRINDIKKINDYLDLNLNHSGGISFYEHSLRPDYIYPKVIYIKFKYSHPETLVKKLNLIPADYSANTDTSRNYDYSLAHVINNFWRVGSTKIYIPEVKEIENKKLKWWIAKSSSIKTYGGFYNEREKKIVSGHDKFNGRLVFYAENEYVYIQIDLLGESHNL